IDCGQDTELRLSPAKSAQGSLVQAELRSATPLTDVSGKWDDKPAPFWQDTAPVTKAAATSNARSVPQDVHRGLIGIDLEKSAGTFDVAVTAKDSGGAAIICKAPITVRAGVFATEHLKVAPNFVEPNPEQLARAQEDGKKLQAIYATVTPEKLWQG